MEIVESILTNNPCFRAGKKMKVKGLMLHSVGCSQPSAEVFMRNWNHPDAARACVHAAALEQGIYKSIRGFFCPVWGFGLFPAVPAE